MWPYVQIKKLIKEPNLMILCDAPALELNNNEMRRLSDNPLFRPRNTTLDGNPALAKRSKFVFRCSNNAKLKKQMLSIKVNLKWRHLTEIQQKPNYIPGCLT